MVGKSSCYPDGQKFSHIASELIKLQGSGVAGLIPTGVDAPFKIREALRRNCLVGMLIDQHDSKGIEVNFFGAVVVSVTRLRGWRACSNARSMAVGLFASRAGSTVSR